MLNNQKGQSTVELALVLPILLLILVGTIVLGLIFKTSIQLDYSANELSRAMSLDATSSEIATLSDAVFNSLDPTKISVTVTPNTPIKGQALTVKVTYTYRLITPLIGTLLGNEVVLSGTSVVIKE